jgi:queuine/archaeosine tRNA-ribosyltransferase
LDFYSDGGFSHGCSVDHLIFDFLDDRAAAPKEGKRRYEITLENAAEFRRLAKGLGKRFTPLGVVQGWSAKSMATAAATLCKQGFDYLAVGGMVPLRVEDIDSALGAIRDAIPRRVKLHVLGFGKTEHLDVLRRHKVCSFDTTSPLLRAFKDGRRNFYSRDKEGQIQYFTAIRIPQAIDNDKLLRRAKRGRLDQDNLLALEAAALKSVRGFANRRVRIEKAVDDVLAYGRYALWDDAISTGANDKRLEQLKMFYLETLAARPWEACKCRVCREIGVEAVIFRSSNRNKRRGIHNLHVFYQFLSDMKVEKLRP